MARPTKIQKGAGGAPVRACEYDDIIVEQKLVEEIPDHFKCPICFEPFIEEVVQCNNGHLICEFCYNKLPSPEKCPSCRSDMSYIRNRAIEDLVAKLPIQCKWKGCPEVCTIEEMRKHRDECKNRKMPCGVTGCVWIGYHDEFLSHCKDKHENRIRSASAVGKYRFNLPEKLPSSASYIVTHNDKFYFVNLFCLPGVQGFTHWDVTSFLDGESTNIKLTYRDGQNVLTLVTKADAYVYEMSPTRMSISTTGPKGRFVVLEFV